MSFVVPQTIVALFNGNELGAITVAFGHVVALTCCTKENVSSIKNAKIHEVFVTTDRESEGKPPDIPKPFLNQVNLPMSKEL
jgi:hypothetical protein